VPGSYAGWQAGLTHSAGAAVQTGFEPHPEFKSFKQTQTVLNSGWLEKYFLMLRKIEINMVGKSLEQVCL
jgi:hypothetical protein